jgi:hypothetical protein
LTAWIVLCLSVALASWSIVWAAYGFRYSPTPDPSIRLDSQPQLRNIAIGETALRAGRAPTESDVAAWRPGFTLRAIDWLDEHHVFPQAWLFGARFVRAHSIIRPSYLLGELRGRGTCYYFPLALAFKEPVSTLVVLFGTILLLTIPGARKRIGAWDSWSAICLTIPMLIYGTAALTGELNLGVRHLLPLYPLAAVAIGVTFAGACAAWPRAGRAVALSLAILLGVESLWVFPNYIAYFNIPSGGPRRGIELLGDSNLDWGQDLPLLAEWQQMHPQENLYLSYFGSADPAFYGVRGTLVPGGFQRAGEPAAFPPPGTRVVLAVSASNLQGMYMPPQLRPMYEQIKSWKPREVLGGTIYLYDLPPSTAPR